MATRRGTLNIIFWALVVFIPYFYSLFNEKINWLWAIPAILIWILISFIFDYIFDLSDTSSEIYSEDMENGQK